MKLRRYFEKFRSVPEHAIVRMAGGYRLSLRPSSDAHERHLYFDLTYEPATLALFDAVLRPGDTMVDAGANLGIMSLHAAKAVGPTGTVIALEPHPVTFVRLLEHIRMNGADNIRAVRLAAGAYRESRSFFEFPAVNVGAASLVAAAHKGNQPAGMVEVDCLDNIVPEESLVRLLKIDVEGFEANVLRGASRIIRSDQPVICMEVSAAVGNGEDNPLAGHDIIMETGVYAAYTFKNGKSRGGHLVPVKDRLELARQVHENVVYVSLADRTDLPRTLFGE